MKKKNKNKKENGAVYTHAYIHTHILTHAYADTDRHTQNVFARARERKSLY